MNLSFFSYGLAFLVAQALVRISSAQDCADQFVALQDDPNVSAEVDKVSRSQSSQFDQCTGTTTCVIDASALLPSFEAVCLQAGGQFFTMDYEINCSGFAIPFAEYKNMPFCVGVNCVTDALAQGFADIITDNYQDSDNEILQTCSADLTGTTPGVTGSPSPSPNTSPPVFPPPSTSPPVFPPPSTSPPSVPEPTLAATCGEQTFALQQDPTLTVETPDFSVADDCVSKGSVLDCEIDFGEVNVGFQQSCLAAGGQYFPVDIQATCTLTNDRRVTLMVDLQDVPTCLGQACDQNAIDDVEKEFEKGFIQGFESSGDFDCMSTQPPTSQPPTSQPPTSQPPALPPTPLPSSGARSTVIGLMKITAAVISFITAFLM